MPVNKIIYGDQTLIDLTDSTVTAGDLRDGVIAYDRSGSRIVGDTEWVLAPVGGASTRKITGTEDDYLLLQGVGVTNVVNGSFIAGNTGDTVQTVQIPYVGNGYPISAMIYVSGGAYNPAVTDWYNAIDRYAIGFWTMHKAIQTSTPTYAASGSENQGVIMITYKNSTSSATEYSQAGSMTANIYSSADASASSFCRFKSATEMSVFVAGDSYGFMPGIEYTYSIVYSE